MFNVLRAEPKTTFEYGPFRIRRMRPGQIQPEKNDDAFGPLSVIDHATLEQGTLVKMQSITTTKSSVICGVVRWCMKILPVTVFPFHRNN